MASCATGNKPTAKTTPTLTNVTFLTGYANSPREMLPHVGVARGYFRAVGINLRILPGAPAEGNITTLLAKRAQFANVDYVSAVRAAAKFSSSNGGYRVLAAVQGVTLLSMMALKGSGIEVPADLKGRTLGAGPNAASGTLFPAYAKLAGIDTSHTKVISAPPDQLPTLLVGHRVDAIGTYAVDVPTIAAAAHGQVPVVLPYERYLGDLYGATLVATEELLRQDRDLCHRFAHAMIQSIKHAVLNPDEAGAAVHAAVPTISASVVSQVAALMLPYVSSARLEESRVMRGIALLEAAGLAGAGLQPEQVVDFTMAKEFA